MSADTFQITSSVATLKQAWDWYKLHHELVRQPNPDQIIIQKIVGHTAKDVLQCLKYLKKGLLENQNEACKVRSLEFALMSREAFTLFSDQNIQNCEKLKTKLRKITDLFLSLNILQLGCREGIHDAIDEVSIDTYIEQFRDFQETLPEINSNSLKSIENQNIDYFEVVTNLLFEQMKKLKTMVMDKKIRTRIENYEQFFQIITKYEAEITKYDDRICEGYVSLAYPDIHDYPRFQDLFGKYTALQNCVQHISATLSQLFPQ